MKLESSIYDISSHHVYESKYQRSRIWYYIIFDVVVVAVVVVTATATADAAAAAISRFQMR